MENQKGFIQIPILIVIILGVLVVGGTSYIGVKQYQNYQVERMKNEELTQKSQEQSNSEVEKLRQEVETLKNQKPQVITQTITKEVPVSSENSGISQDKSATLPLTYIQNQSQVPSITEIVGNWRFFTAKVEHSDRSGWGSGFITKSSDGTFKILTNKHVVEGGTIFNIRFPGNPFNPFRSAVIYRGSEDFATLSLGNSDEYLKNLISGNAYQGICPENQKPILGDEILILGYPATGSQTDVTVTRGIISGFERNYYITDAKINPGNSGGVAINIKNNCYFGIPTYGVNTKTYTATETLGRILDIWKVMNQF